MKINLIVSILFLNFHFSYSQEEIAYKCTSFNKGQISIKTTPASQPLKYQGKEVFLYKYEINFDNKKLSSFFLYIFEKKLYIIDGNITKLNHTKDQILFSIPHQNSYTASVVGLGDDLALNLSKFFTVNDLDFYYYNVASKSNSSTPILIKEIVFDKSLRISEFKLISGKSECACTKTKIVVRLK